MNFKIDLNKIMTALATASVIFLVGAVWDFQNLKGRLAANEREMVEVKTNLRSMGARIDVMARLDCSRAIKEKLTDAEAICQNVLRQ